MPTMGEHAVATDATMVHCLGTRGELPLRFMSPNVGDDKHNCCELGAPSMGTLKERIKESEREQELMDDISAELSYDPSIVGANRIDVSTAEGVVTLEGEVDSLAQRWAVEHAV